MAAHPDVQLLVVDFTGGYPTVAGALHEWPKLHVTYASHGARWGWGTQLLTAPPERQIDCELAAIQAELDVNTYDCLLILRDAWLDSLGERILAGLTGHL